MTKKLNRNVYNMVGSWLYYEMRDFKSKLLQIKTGLYTNK